MCKWSIKLLEFFDQIFIKTGFSTFEWHLTTVIYVHLNLNRQNYTAVINYDIVLQRVNIIVDSKIYYKYFDFDKINIG